MVWRPKKHLIFLNKVRFNLSDWALENNSVSLSQAAVFSFVILLVLFTFIYLI